MTNQKNPREHPLRPTFAFAYHQFALPLTKFLVKKLHGDQDAVDDVFSQTIEAAWKGHTAFKSKSTYYTWLCRIALNKIADYYRLRINRRSGWIAPFLDSIANLDSINPTPEEKLALLELKEALVDCLNLVPEKNRQILHLHFWKELTIGEIAALQGISKRATEGQIYRARKNFQKVFKQKYPDLSPEFRYTKK